MSIIAERAYAHVERNKKKESPEDREYRLAQKYNSIFHSIAKVSDAKSYLQVKQAINMYASEVGKDNMDVKKLSRMLNTRINEVSQEIESNIQRIHTKIENIKNDRIIEPAEHIQELNMMAEQKLYEIMLTLSKRTNPAGINENRRRIGNYLAQADRITALALLRVASLPQFEDCFSQKQKELILEKSKNPAEVIHERNKQPLLKEQRATLGKEYMRGFSIRHVQKQISNSENQYYFNEDKEN